MGADDLRTEWYRCEKRKNGVGRPEGAQLVHLTDFESFDVRGSLSPQQEYLLEQFNTLSAKVDHLTALVEKVVSAIEPRPIEKPLPSALGPKKP